MNDDHARKPTSESGDPEGHHVARNTSMKQADAANGEADPTDTDTADTDTSIPRE